MKNKKNSKNTVLMFPGQGSQYTGMGKKLIESDNKYSEYFKSVSSIIGKDLLKIINGEGQYIDELNKTVFTQPAIYALNCAYYDFIKNMAIIDTDNVKAVVGHSLGDYSALYCCGTYDFETGAGIVAERGRIMEEASSSAGGMVMAAVIGVDYDRLEELVAGYDNVYIVNYNSLHQIVIGGLKNDIDGIAKDIKTLRRARIIPLKVNIASHCPLMKDAAENLESYLDDNLDLNDLAYNFFSSTEIGYVDKKDIKNALARQLTRKVNWVKTISSLLEEGFNYFVEVGPGEVLTGLLNRILKEQKIDNITVKSIDDHIKNGNLNEKLNREGRPDET